MGITAALIKDLAFRCGFELAGITPARPAEDFARFERWQSQGYAGEMRYMTDRRGDLRADPRNLLPSAQSILCVGKVYRTARENAPKNEGTKPARGRISRYARGGDYHELMRNRLTELVNLIRERCDQPFEWRISVDTAPLLERSYARLAGLGWIGKNTCLINQQQGSWIFLGEVLLSVPLPPDSPAPARCGTCTRCIDACPTDAIVPDGNGGWSLDSRLCISYLTIEKRGEVPAELAARTGNHLFGCDICQEVCPWNGRAPVSDEPWFALSAFAPLLTDLAALTEEKFRQTFRHTPVWRAKYAGFLRNVAFAMGNSGQAEMLRPLERLARHADPLVASSARQALAHLKRTTPA
ncbi:MAG TPA: tRNA epoxyqueuosine(34) reductase QueG [Bryobacteraceae bacterium]